MENASKSLIIAGAILIAIFLISFGIIIINSMKDSTKSAQKVGETIEASVSSARIKTILSTIDYEDDEEFIKYIQTNYGNDKTLTKNEVIELCEIVMVRTQIIYNGEKYQGNTIHLPSASTRGEVYYDSENKTIYYGKLVDRDYYLILETNPTPAGSVAMVIKPK